MNAYAYHATQDDPRDAMAWLAQAFAQRMAVLARRLGATDDTCRRVARAAFAVSVATADGHVCVPLSDLLDGPGSHELFPDQAPELTAWRDALLASGICTRASAASILDSSSNRPLRLDAQDRLYLARYHSYEVRLAAALAALTGPAENGGENDRDHAPDAADVARLHEQFGDGTVQASGRRVPNWQMAAAALALRRRVVVLSGGPGTGKTTTVVGLLACLLAREPALRVALAAPTGKAAQRMQEALAARAAHLPAVVRDALPPAALTLHRLLGVMPDSAGLAPRFRHHAQNPLPYDLIVIDEASMIDLSLATHLLEAVPRHARLILLGDKDQLAAVEAGAVFAELSANPALSAGCCQWLSHVLGVADADLVRPAHAGLTPLADSVIWLEHNYRFGGQSAIGLLADAIRQGSATAARQCLVDATDDAGESTMSAAGRVMLRETPDLALDAQWLAELADGYTDYLEAVRTHSDEPAVVFDAFGRFRVLCATRGGPRGVDVLNAQLGAAFLRRGAFAPTTAAQGDGWYPGRPVLITRNDYALGLFNGDVGIALPVAGAAGGRVGEGSDEPAPLRVWFASADGTYRPFTPGSLPAHDTAFAMTVHKSQGSEFDRVAIVLPTQGSRVLTRELVYTAITRARRDATLYASWRVVAAAIATPTRRASGLAERLAEVGAVRVP